ncbi:MAG: hypothetical protein IJM17_05905, partial [Firmicutes bacterium]|nr:hypothetical protein [Bacillota bacterium]
MKRLLVLLLTVIFTAGSLACCAPSHTNAPAAEPAEPAEAAVSDPAPSTVPTELSSAEASSNPSETAEPAAAPEDAPAAPSPVEDPGISFSASANLPLPNTEEDIPQGQPFTFGGTVYSDAPILEIAAVIGSSDGSEKKYSVSFSGSDNKTSVELVDITFPSEDDRSLTAKVPFQEFPEGSYTFELTASNTRAENVPIASSSFNIVSSEWRSLISNNLRNNYAYALSFFGSRDEFMFRYKWRNDTD